jgi:isoleucyl-tRNA synthetase
MSLYKDTVFLPTTSFTMQRPTIADEAAMVRSWGHLYQNYGPRSVDLTDDDPFVLHDGPPYANGDIHIGHAMNKVLKDFIVRSQRGMNKSVDYRPGWDCHGLPIETQVEKILLEEGVQKKRLGPVAFRDRCREYAQGQMDKQRDQFKALGVMADYKARYSTMDFASEAAIADRLHLLLVAGLLYRGKKPILWSTIEETALAEAEVEHKPIKVTSAYVAFRIYAEGKDMRDPSAEYVIAPIWTTTPWTIPANRAIAFNPALEYRLYRVLHAAGTVLNHGEQLVLAKSLAPKVLAELGVTEWEELERYELAGREYYSPLANGGSSFVYNNSMPFIVGNHVTDAMGTGLVHTAPDHGPDDYACWMKYCEDGAGSEFYPILNADGTFSELIPGIGGMNVLNQTPKGEYIFEYTNAVMIETLGSAVLGRAKVEISYPHSWRSKAPLVYRVTPQWFMSVDDDLRGICDKAIDEVLFPPGQEPSKERLKASMASRPDWLISRQRWWGTPLALFFHKDTNEPLRDEIVNARIVETFREEGGNSWWERPKTYWLELAEVNPDDYVQCMDVLDVWFDSASSLALIEFGQADLYLEGTDQHRGWFGSSLLQQCAILDTYVENYYAPFAQLVTHGFVLDAKGEKMSKSKGNVIPPEKVVADYGTDVLRLWVATSDYTQDIRAGDKIFDSAADIYKKLRLTIRYLLGALQGWSDDEWTRPSSPLENFVLSRMNDLNEDVAKAYAEYRFNDVVRMVMNYSSNTLSSFFFDIRKDTLYCDPLISSVKRREYRTALLQLLQAMTAWLQPIVPFMMDEAFVALGWSRDQRIITRGYPIDFADDEKKALEDRFGCVFEVLDFVNDQLEALRRDKTIKTGLDLFIQVHMPERHFKAFEGLDAAEILRVSQVGLFVNPNPKDNEFKFAHYPAKGERCERSRRFFYDVGSDPNHPTLSARDALAVEEYKFINQP